MYQQVIAALRTAYNQSAGEREQRTKARWKLEERQTFLELLQQEGKQTLLEIGAGTGQDSKFFQDHGLHVICTDLSPTMIQYCREKGLEAYVMDFLHLDFPAHSFDALYSINSLLHVPEADLSAVLTVLQRLLKPNGLFYVGIYGGKRFEGTWPDDTHEPKRFFSYHTEEQIQEIMGRFFTIQRFNRRDISDCNERFHFQALTLRQK